MVTRILKGKRLDGTFGFDVSKPGFDVLTASPVQLAFSSDYISPVKVIGGTDTISPTNGPAPLGAAGQYPGAKMTTKTIYFGRYVSPIPNLFAVGSAPSWNVPLYAAPTSQLGYLAGQYHTYLSERMMSTGVNDDTYGPVIKRNQNVAGSNGEVDNDWASARFIGLCFNDRIEFRYNGSATLTVKYLVLES